MAEEWSKEKEEILRLVAEMEKIGIQELAEYIAKANTLIKEHKRDKTALRNLELAKEDLETRFQEKIAGTASLFQKLLEKKVTLETRIRELETKINTLEGLVMIQKAINEKTGCSNGSAKIDQYRAQITSMQTSIDELKELLERVSITITAYEDNISSVPDLELPPEICRRYHHPSKVKRQVAGRRGEGGERWYCPNCKKFVDEDL